MDEKDNITQNRYGSKRSYIVTVLCYLLVVVFCMLNEDIFEKETVQEVVGALSNAFFLPGVLFAGIGALSKIAATGAYDMLGYGFSNIGIHQWIPMLPKEKYESFYEYKVAKDEKGRVWFPNMLFTGLAGLLVSLVLVVVYSAL